MKNKIDVSIICCCNNKQKLNEYLLKGYERQNSACEVIVVENENNRFESAAKALNYGASVSKGKVLIFCHQDIEFLSEDCLDNIYEILKEKDIIIGAAGSIPKMKCIISWMDEERSEGMYTYNPALTEQPTLVQTLDECIIAMRKDTYESVRFDEEVCDGWHLYSADICLSALELGIESYVIPLKICHHSQGRADKNFFRIAKKLVKKHKKKNKAIKTACIYIKNTAVPFDIYMMIKKSRHFIGIILKKICGLREDA